MRVGGSENKRELEGFPYGILKGEVLQLAYLLLLIAF